MDSIHPKVSVIIPVYNAAPYLHRCIDSILSQTFPDFELLLIDDGSKDRSGEICDEYADLDTRVRVFHKENGGVSSARNVGLDHARGEWVTFIDADDFVRLRYLEHLLNHVGEQIDLVISYAEGFGKEGSKKEVYPSRTVENANFEIMFIENDMHWHTSPWSKLYRRSVIESLHLRFCEGMHIGEDALFLYTFMLDSRVIYLSSDTDYCYFACVEDSLTKRVNLLDSELLSCSNIRAIVRKLIQSKSIQHPRALNNLNWLIASYQRRVLNALYHNRIERHARLDILKKTGWNYYTDYIQKDSRKERILIELLKHDVYCLYDFVRILSIRVKAVLTRLSCVF